MIQKPVEAIVAADLQALVGMVRENRRIEFKAQMPGRGDKDTGPFLASVTSFANTIGGDLVLGISENDGVAASVPGLAVASVDGMKQTLEELLVNCVEPRLPRVDIHPVPVGDGRHALVIRVGKSLIGPHRVLKNSKFYGRNSAGKYEMDVGELRSAFVQGSGLPDRIRAFRDARIARLHSHKTAVPLAKPGLAVLHVVPAQALSEHGLVDYVDALRNGTHMPLPLQGPSGVNRRTYNLDGLVNYQQTAPEGASSYVQFFRSGIHEGVGALRQADDKAHAMFLADPFCDTICAAVAQYCRVMKSLDIGFPAFVFLSLCGAPGVVMRYVGADQLSYETPPLKETPVLFPEVQIGDDADDIPEQLRPMFDALWNAYGFERSYRYNDAGVWQGPKV